MSGKLLYFGPSGIGDWCFIWPSLTQLMTACDCDRLSVIVPYRNAGNRLLSHNPLVTELDWLDREFGKRLPVYGARWLKLARRIRKQKYDALAVSYLSNQPDFLAMAICSKIPIRIGFPPDTLLGRTAFSHQVTPGAAKGKVAIHAAYWKTLGNASESVACPLFADTLFTEQSRLLRRLELTGKYIVLGIGGGRLAKWRFWPADNFRRLIMMNSQHRFVLLGGGHDDAHQAQQIIGNGLANAVNLVNKVRMDEALSVLRGAAAVIGNDSGLANIAATLGVKTICLYGPTDLGLTGPALLGADSARIATDCAPCFGEDQDPAAALACPHRKCLSHLSPARITAWLDEAVLQ